MDYLWASEHEVRFAGEEGALTVCLGLGPTGVLISREMRLECGPLDGRVRAWFDFDLALVRGELRALLVRPDLTGHVRVTGSEHGEFGAAIDLRQGRGVLSATLASGFARAEGGGVLKLSTNQSYLRQSLDAMDRLVR